MARNDKIKQGFAFDRLSVIPQIECVSPNEVGLETRLTKNIQIQNPFVASPMDSVINYKMAKKILDSGGVPIFYIFGDKIKDILQDIKTLRTLYSYKVNIGICISPNIEIIKDLSDYFKYVDLVALDTLHSSAYCHLEALSFLKSHFSSLEVISGNITNLKDCQKVINAGADAVRVGMTNNSINLGNQILGCGRMQGSALLECGRICYEKNIPLIADGGIQSVRDVIIAIALGADCVMMGSVFAAMEESPCEVVVKKGQPFKVYRGMSRDGVIEDGYIAESVSRFLPARKGVIEEISTWSKLLKIAVARCGQKNIDEVKKNAILEWV